ncbi:MAG: hypothetical protein U0840_24960 [Gemmataceae bacterium]
MSNSVPELDEDLNDEVTDHLIDLKHDPNLWGGYGSALTATAS